MRKKHIRNHFVTLVIVLFSSSINICHFVIFLLLFQFHFINISNPLKFDFCSLMQSNLFDWFYDQNAMYFSFFIPFCMFWCVCWFNRMQISWTHSSRLSRHWIPTITLRLQTQKDYAIYSILIVVCSHIGKCLECMFFFLFFNNNKKCFGFRSRETQEMNPNHLQLLVSDVWALIWNNIYIAHALQQHTHSQTHTHTYVHLIMMKEEAGSAGMKELFAAFQMVDQLNNKFNTKIKCLQNWVTANSWWQCKRLKNKQHDTNHFL